MDRPDPPVAGGLYQHCKGGLYRIEALAEIEADRSPAVVCVPIDPQDGGHRWIRPAAVFTETVVDPHGNERPRFARVEMPDDCAFRRHAYGSCGLAR